MSRLSQLCVVLVNTRNPLNIGAVARAMANFDFSCLRVVNPYEPSFREARSAVGAAHLLQSAEQYDTVAAAIADCSLVIGTTAARDRELQHRLKLLPQAAREIHAATESGKVAILFGSEKRGLSNQDLSYCHWILRIPTSEEHPSMNLGQSVAVTLYEIARDPGIDATADAHAPLATSQWLERIAQTILEGLILSGYADGTTRAPTEAKLRRLLHRMTLSASDAETLLGMVRQLLWKLRSAPPH